jgi:hypothetical protein
MGSFTNYAEASVLNNIFFNQTTAGGARYLALSTTSVQEDGSGLTEPSGAGYARIDISTGAVGFAPGYDSTETGWSTGYTFSNVLPLSFAAATGSWGTIEDWAIIDSSSGGNILAYGSLATSTAVNTTDLVTIPAYSIDISVPPTSNATFGEAFYRELRGWIYPTSAAASANTNTLSTKDCYASLHTASGEVTGGGYARVDRTTSSGVLSTATNSAANVLLSSTAFPEATAGWGVVTEIGFGNVSTAGGFMFKAKLNSDGLDILTGNILTITPTVSLN